MWLGVGGVPVAVQEVVQVKGRRLLLSIEIGDTTRYTLQVIGTRLLAVSRGSGESHSIFGQAGSSVTDAAQVPVASNHAR